RRSGGFPALARRSGAISDALWLHVFLNRKCAAFDLALVSGLAALAGRRPVLVAGAMPWLVMRWRSARTMPGRHPVVRVAQLAAGDVAEFAALTRGSVRHRRLVL